MNHYINTHPEMGRMLWLEQGDIQIGVALDYGIRVRHLSIKGMENMMEVAREVVDLLELTEEQRYRIP